MIKNKSGVDFADQEIIIGRVVIYASGGSLKCGIIERTTEKSVFLKCGKMVSNKKVFVLGEDWTTK